MVRRQGWETEGDCVSQALRTGPGTFVNTSVNGSEERLQDLSHSNPTLGWVSGLDQASYF